VHPLSAGDDGTDSPGGRQNPARAAVPRMRRPARRAARWRQIGSGEGLIDKRPLGLLGVLVSVHGLGRLTLSALLLTWQPPRRVSDVIQLPWPAERQLPAERVELVRGRPAPWRASRARPPSSRWGRPAARAGRRHAVTLVGLEEPRDRGMRGSIAGATLVMYLGGTARTVTGCSPTPATVPG
jgi:hypothetical protein